MKGILLHQVVWVSHANVHITHIVMLIYMVHCYVPTLCNL
jgi:hypothetical protein